MQIVPDTQIDQDAPIIDQLAVLTEAIIHQNVDAKKVIEERAEEKYSYKLTKKISQEVAVNKVKLSELVTQLEPVISELVTLVQKLCTVENFTTEHDAQIAKLNEELKAIAQSLSTKPNTFKMHYDKLVESKWLRLEIQNKEIKIRDDVTELQSLLLPNLTLLMTHMTKAKTLISTPEMSIAKSIYDMHAQIKLEHMTLEHLKEKGEKLMEDIKRSHKYIFDKL